MAIANEILVIEIGAVTTAIMTGIGAIYRQAIRNRQATDRVLNELQKAAMVAKLKDTELTDRISSVATRVDKVERIVQIDHDNLTGVATMLDEHLRWHERARPNPGLR